MCIIIITMNNINRRFLFIPRYFQLTLSHLSWLGCKHCAFILWQLHIVLIQHAELLTEQCQLKSMGTQPMRQKSNKKHFYVFQILNELFWSRWTIMKLDKKNTFTKTNKKMQHYSQKNSSGFTVQGCCHKFPSIFDRCEWVGFAKQSSKGETREERWGSDPPASCCSVFPPM